MLFHLEPEMREKMALAGRMLVHVLRWGRVAWKDEPCSGHREETNQARWDTCSRGVLKQQYTHEMMEIQI